MFIFIGTGNYWSLAKDAVDNWNQNLLIGDIKVDFLLLTDRHPRSVWDSIPYHCMIRYAPKLPFPLPTLLRYHFFLENLDILENYDYIYFVNADMRIQGKLDIKELLPQKEYNLVGIQHPGFTVTKEAPITGTFETNPNSTSRLEGWKLANGIVLLNVFLTPAYLIGAFQGGRSKQFIDMCKFLKENIDIDLKNRVLAIWDDESHLQRYAQTMKKFQVLPPTYCQPEGWLSFGPTKILKLQKNHEEIRS